MRIQIFTDPHYHHISCSVLPFSAFSAASTSTYPFNYISCRGRSKTAVTSTMKLFVIIVGWKLLTIITKSLDVAAVLDPPLYYFLYLTPWQVPVPKIWYSVTLRIQSECGKIRTRKNSIFRHFWRSVMALNSEVYFSKFLSWLTLRLFVLWGIFLAII